MKRALILEDNDDGTLTMTVKSEDQPDIVRVLQITVDEIIIGLANLSIYSQK
jgi:hypothetical protein